MKDSVTLRDVYDVVNRLEEKMDDQLKPMRKDIEDLKDFRSRALGILSIATIALSGLFSFIWKRIEG